MFILALVLSTFIFSNDTILDSNNDIKQFEFSVEVANQDIAQR